MKTRVLIRPEARGELMEAAAWYRERSSAVAAAFRSAIRQTIVRIAERPESFFEVSPRIRRALTAQFPYAIFFARDADAIIVLAVKHQAQDPETWPSAEAAPRSGSNS